MSIFREIGRGVKGLCRGGEHVLRGSFMTAASFFSGGGHNSTGVVFYQLLKYLFSKEGEFLPGTDKVFCRIMNSSFPDSNAAQVWYKVESAPLCDHAGIVAALRGIPAEKLTSFVSFAAAMVQQMPGDSDAGKKLERCVLEDEPNFHAVPPRL